jgi:drug/metabolite transporter (DMT)-like permease
MTTAGENSKGNGLAPHAALLVVQLLFGTWPIIGKIALRTLPSTGLVALRTTGAAITLILLQKVLRLTTSVERNDLPRLFLYALIGVVGNQLLFVKGLSLTTAINAVLLGTTIPIFSMAVSVVMGFEKLSVRGVLGVIISAAGVIYLLWPERHFASGTTIGNLLIIGNSFCYGAYIAMSRDMVGRYGALTVITWIFIFGSILTLPIGLYVVASGPHIEVAPKLVLSVLFIILLPTVGAYYLNAWALLKVPPSVVAVYFYLQPLFAFAISPLVLGERPTSRTALSTLLVLTGVALVTLRSISRVGLRPGTESSDSLGHTAAPGS